MNPMKNNGDDDGSHYSNRQYQQQRRQQRPTCHETLSPSNEVRSHANAALRCLDQIEAVASANAIANTNANALIPVVVLSVSDAMLVL